MGAFTARPLRTLILFDRFKEASLLRVLPTSTFTGMAEAICDAPSVLRTFAAPEWSELNEDGKQWVAAIVREALAVAAERAL
ncbi:hypothetical protein ASE70_08105 [Sphingomonas sp. Leaf22]|nr:hypothetical protein ASE70_08105 [Sphingomonas sp. Leaf22]